MLLLYGRSVPSDKSDNQSLLFSSIHLADDIVVVRSASLLAQHKRSPIPGQTLPTNVCFSIVTETSVQCREECVCVARSQRAAGSPRACMTHHTPHTTGRRWVYGYGLVWTGLRREWLAGIRSEIVIPI